MSKSNFIGSQSRISTLVLHKGRSLVIALILVSGIFVAPALTMASTSSSILQLQTALAQLQAQLTALQKQQTTPAPPPTTPVPPPPPGTPPTPPTTPGPTNKDSMTNNTTTSGGNGQIFTDGAEVRSVYVLNIRSAVPNGKSIATVPVGFAGIIRCNLAPSPCPVTTTTSGNSKLGVPPTTTTWWYVDWSESGLPIGWTAGQQNSTIFLLAVTPPPPPTTPPSQSNQPVVVSVNTSASTFSDPNTWVACPLSNTTTPTYCVLRAGQYNNTLLGSGFALKPNFNTITLTPASDPTLPPLIIHAGAYSFQGQVPGIPYAGYITFPIPLTAPLGLYNLTVRNDVSGRVSLSIKVNINALGQ